MPTTDMMRSERGPEGVALLVSQLGSLWNRLGRGQQLAAVLLLVAVAGGFAWIVMADRAPAWATVVTAHRDDEARECVAVLQRAGVAVRANGRDIDVPPEQLAAARRALVAEGLPDPGVGLHSFDESSFMSSAFAEQVSYKRALQEELERSIKGLAPVDGARVHLAMGRRSLFKDRDQRPSASVVLRLRPGQMLDGAAVRGIRQLVVGSVEGMTADDVSVIDHLGNLLDGEAGLASGDREEMEEAVSGKVRGLLERVVGEGNVVVVASAELDLRRIDEKAESVAATGAATGAAGDGAAGVGAASSPAGSVAAAAPGAAPSHVVTETRFPSARLQRLQLAVVVNYRRGPDGALVAPSADELARWTDLVRSAAGIDDSRGDRVELQAAPLAPRGFDRGELPPVIVASPQLPSPRMLAMGAAGLLLAALLGQMWLRRRYARKLEAAQGQVALAEQRAAASERRAVEATQATHALQVMHAAQGANGGGAGSGATTARRPAAERAGEAVRRDLDGAALVLGAWLGGEREGDAVSAASTSSPMSTVSTGGGALS